MPKHRWTEGKKRELVAFIEAGGSLGRASVRFKCTEVAIKAQAQELGLRLPTIKERRLRAMGVTDAARPCARRLVKKRPPFREGPMGAT